MSGKKTIFVPKSFLIECVNPANFLGLKNKFSLKTILVFDRTKPKIKNVCIVDHVNRSGFNFFIGSSPVKNLAMFPDMSNIYKPVKGLTKITVHTLGPKRFSEEKTSNIRTSEITGLISPVWHYVGVKVSAITD